MSAEFSTVAQEPSAAEMAQLQREAMQAAREQMQAQREQAQAARDQARAQAEAARAQAEAARAGGGPVIVDNHGVMRIIGEDGKVVTIQTTGIPGMPPMGRGGRNAGPPESVLYLVGIVMFFLTLMVIGWPLARAYARRMDRRSVAPTSSPDHDARLARIENAVDAIAVEVERVSEGQRFATRLLAERAEADAALGVARDRVPLR